VQELLGRAATPHLTGMTPAVYGLVLPETRETLHRLWHEQPDALFECAYDDRQDAAHSAFLSAWRAWVAPLVNGLPGFDHQYVTNGSSESIRESVWSFAGDAHAIGLAPHLHVFAGEYEGYAAYARAAGITVVVHRRSEWEDRTAYTRDALHRWYVSQPSAIDGNVWTAFESFVSMLHDRGVEVAVDLAYVGAAPVQPVLDLSLPNVVHVFFSLSKVFGVFYHRVGGMLSRQPLLGLEGNRWFKNTFSLYLGASLIAHVPSPTTLPAKYRGVQMQACQMLRDQHDIPLVASDVILLATSPAGAYPKAFRRGQGFRYCLTPAMDGLLRSGDPADA
jgi:hypothetical protein